jgi:hypothetical protein
MSFTTQELIECAQRELAMRRTCYPKWAAGKPLTPSKQKEIDMMEAIVQRLQTIALPSDTIAKCDGCGKNTNIFTSGYCEACWTSGNV